MAAILNRELSAKRVEGMGGASHTFSEEEKSAFSQHINFCLAHDALLQRHLPLDPDSMDLFEKTSDGLILCKLINLASADAIDERAINKKENMNIYHKTENQNLVVNAAKAIGCQVINIGAQDLIEGRPILVLGLVWQVIKIQLLSQITLKNFPELVLLLKEGETMADLMKLHPELILLRWLNYHLRKARCERVVNNFGNDLADSEVYSIVLNRLNPALCPLVPSAADPLMRAQLAIENATKLGVQVFLKPKDICDGNKKLNISLVAQLFNTCHGLNLNEEEEEIVKTMSFDLALVNDEDLDKGDSREERVFRMWINSLNIENVYINDLFSEMMDGVNLLRVMDTVHPGIVNWKKVNIEPKSRFKRVENGNYAIEIAKQLKFSLINIGGLDIIDGNKKMILAVFWQLMRKYMFLVLSELGRHQGLAEVTEEHIVAWANARVKASGKRTMMRSFKDTNLKNSMFFLDLLAAIEPRAVDWEDVTRGDTEENAMLNAKYAISCARKIGACVFLTPEDIVEVKSKMLLTYVAGVWMADLIRSS